MATGLGTQRGVFLQTKEEVNRRRKRRQSKQRRKATLPLEERVFHILATSKLKDFTHPSETDPYWGYIYKQYEYLRYAEMYFRAALSETTEPLSDEEIVDAYCTLQIIEEYKTLLMRYLVNAMAPMYGSVMAKKFYGWYEFADEFISKFNETALQTIESLRFDIERTRCSVYFYQVFWLTGISFKSEIADQLYKYEYFELKGDDRDETFSVSDEEVYTVVEEQSTEETDIQIEVDDTLNHELMQELSEKFDWSVEEKQDNQIELEYNLIEKENEEETDPLKEVVDALLQQVGLTRESLKEKNINDLGLALKRLMRKGKIKLSAKHKQMLREIGFSV